MTPDHRPRPSCPAIAGLARTRADALPARAPPGPVPVRGPLGRGLACALLALSLGGCAVGVGFGIPLAPGLSLGVGFSNAGPAIGLNTGWGPLGAGVAVDGGGRVLGSAGVGASAGPVGVGVGSSTLLYDPAAQAPPPSVAGAYAPVAPSAPLGPRPGNVEAP